MPRRRRPRLPGARGIVQRLRPLQRHAWVSLALALAGCDSDGRPPPPQAPAPEWRVIFEDGFDGDSLDAGKWTIAVADGCPQRCGGVAPRHYSAESVSTSHGALVLAPAATEGEWPSGAAVHTAGKFDFLYGRVEVTARLPAGPGLWPSIRLLPADATRYGALPSAGEVGIAEGDGAGAVRSITRYGLPTPPYHGAAAAYALGGAADGRTVEYAVEWDWSALRFFLDGVHVHTQSADQWYAYYPADAARRHDPLGPYRLALGSPPFDQRLHLAIELTRAPEAATASLAVERVRVLECVGATQGGVGCGTADAGISPLADGAGGPLAGRNTARPHRERLDLYANGPATLVAPVAGAPVAAMLIDGTWGAEGALAESDLNAADAGAQAGRAWRVAVAGGAGEAYLALANLSQDAATQTGFDFSGNRLPGPGSEPVGEVAFDLLVREIAPRARISIGMDAGYPNGPRFELPPERLGRDTWRTHSVKFSHLAGDGTFELGNVTRPFVFRAEGGRVDALIDNIRVVNACKVVGGCGAATAEVVARRRSCVPAGRALNVGFYAFFEPVSASADPDPSAPAFNRHRGFEADLLSALEAMEGAGFAFERRAIPTWPGIWLRSATPEFDIVGGGITILESRTMNAAGEAVVAFTDGHIAFRQSLLVRSDEAARFPNHAALTSAHRVGALAGTTGEFRLLELTGLADAAGTLAAGTRVTTPRGVVVADGSAAYRIHPAGATANLAGRERLQPPVASMPQVIYLGDDLGEAELLAALADGRIDAVARGEIGNSDAAFASGGQFAVAALDQEAEYGGFTVARDDGDLLACLNDKIRWLTAGGGIGYPQWREDSEVFLARAELWNDAL